MRLRSAVGKAKTAESSFTRDAGNARYRQMTEGLVWGENFKEKEQKPERYSNPALRIRVDLTPEERAAYDEAYAAYTGYVREAGLRETYGPGWWNVFTRRSARSRRSHSASSSGRPSSVVI